MGIYFLFACLFCLYFFHELDYLKTFLNCKESICSRGCLHCVCVLCLVLSVTSNSLQSHRLQPTRLLCPQHSPGKKCGVGSQSLLQGIFPTQESNLSLCTVGRYFTTEPPVKPISSMVTGHCCWGFGCHFVVLLAELLLVPDRQPYCFLPLFLGEKNIDGSHKNNSN